MSEPSLHLADWRFLLPGPMPRRAVSFTDDDRLNQAVRLVAETVLDSQSIPPGSCDLAVARNPTRRTLDAAQAALVSGGCCYVEWSLWRAIRSAVVRHRMSVSGFEDCQVFLAWPQQGSAADAGIWVPLESAPAVAYFQRTRHVPAGRLKDAARAVHGALIQWLSPMLVVLPWLVATGKRAPRIVCVARTPRPEASAAGASSEVAGLIGRIREHAVPAGTTSQVSLLLRSENTSTCHATVVAFSGASPMPRTITKIVRGSSGDINDQQVASEIAVLRALRHCSLREGSIPEVIGEERFGDYRAQTQTFVGGRPMTDAANTDNYGRLASLVTAWLVTLAEQAPCAQPPADWPAPRIRALMRDVWPPADDGAAPLSDAVIATLEGVRLNRLVPRHGDLGPWNIRLDTDDRVGVIDWHDASMEGIAGLDLLYFLAMLAFHVEDAWTPAALRRTYAALLDKTTRLGSVYDECVNAYMTSLDLPHATVPALRLATWLLHLHFEDVAQRRSSIFFTLWQVEAERTGS